MTDTTDREMLELAAKAIGIKITWHGDVDPWCFAEVLPGIKWNPLTDDGDALRLAVKLNMRLVIGGNGFKDFTAWAQAGMSACEEYFNDDPRAATRRAIVCAAAEIGRGMK